MYPYANEYTCASAPDQKSIVLSFRQKVPVFTDEGDMEEIKSVPVASVIIGMDVAKHLGTALHSLLGDYQTQED